MCSQLVEHAPHDVLAAMWRDIGGEIRGSRANLARRVPDCAGAAVLRSGDRAVPAVPAVAELLTESRRSVPVVVVLDDFHWADGQSVALLKHVAGAVGAAARCRSIVTYRDTDLGKDHPLTGLLADLRRLDGVERIALSGLGVDEVAADDCRGGGARTGRRRGRAGG